MVQIAFLGACSAMIAGFAGYMVQVRTEASVYEVEHVLCLAIVSFLSLIITMKLIPIVMAKCLVAGLFGRDINKAGDSKVPESLGIVSATVCMMSVICFQWVFKEELGVYNAALIAMSMMLFLGFADDVLDLRWRDKVLLSYVAAVPLLFGYAGGTTVLLPRPLHGLFGPMLDLGFLYYVYMINTVVWCTNSINIYAGINGLETGQSVVMAFFVLVHNCLELGSDEDHQHVLSIFIMLPFLSTSLGLTYFNWFPSAVFVGDTYTYFAGMTLAVCGILGHFSKTLVILFVPQIINFILSVPQLLHIIPCPRHRLARLDKATGKLHYTRNGTLINAWLYLFGPRTERELCVHLVAFQVVCCTAGLLVRHQATIMFY